MNINARARYAVMAMADLTKHAEKRAVSLSEIAERQKLSEAYLGQIFAQLRQAGLVASVRGRGGGYQLARPAEDIMVADVMGAVEERIHMTRCTIDHATGCVDGKSCLTHGLWDALGHHIKMFLANISLQDVIDNGPALRMSEMTFAMPSGKEIAAK